VKTAGNEFSAPLLEKGERVLVFSQFVGLLEILREEIDSRGWRHWYLAG
jgi:SNF2 family DNA or RNA helicase